MKYWAVLAALVLWPFTSVSAQLPGSNDEGVAWGAVHLTVRDLEANKRFFVTLGGTAIKIDGGDVVTFPGLMVFLTQGAPAGNNQGTAVNHFGLAVPSIVESVPKWRAAGIKADAPRNSGEFTFVYTPDDLKIEVNPSQTPFLWAFPVGMTRELPVSSYHLHFWQLDDSVAHEMEAWYTKVFGAVLVAANRPGGTGQPPPIGPQLSVPGTLMTFQSGPSLALDGRPTMPTKGQVLDRIGFEVKNLEAFCQKLGAMGVKFDEPYSASRHQGYASARFTDRWGTSVELTEGLRRF